MKAIIGGNTYDTESAERQATFLTYSDTEHELHRTADGEFFLVLDDSILDGRRLGPLEDLRELAPELAEPLSPMLGGRRETKAARRRRLMERYLRLRRETRLVPVTAKEAMRWCIQTQIPDCFKGYLLDCL